MPTVMCMYKANYDCRQARMAVYSDLSKHHDAIRLTPRAQGRVQQLTGRIVRAIGMTYVRQVSCWTTLILIQ